MLDYRIIRNEDIEEAVIQYLKAQGRNDLASKIEAEGLYFKDICDEEFISTQYLVFRVGR